MTEVARLLATALHSRASLPSLRGTQELLKPKSQAAPSPPQGVESGGRKVNRGSRSRARPRGGALTRSANAVGGTVWGGARGRGQEGGRPAAGRRRRSLTPRLPRPGGASTSSPRTCELGCPSRAGPARLPPPPGVPCAFWRESSRAGASTSPGEAGSALTRPCLPCSRSRKGYCVITDTFSSQRPHTCPRSYN